MKNDNEKKEAAKSEYEMLLDGSKVPVTFRPPKEGEPAPAGTDLLVRKIPICDMDPLGRAFGKNIPEVAVYLDRDEAFVRTLSDESFVAVFEEGRRLNFPAFKKWWEWQEQTLDALGQQQDREDLITRVVEKLAAKQNQSGAGAKSASASASSS